MVEDTILQHEIFTKFILPFLLVFFIVFAVLDRTKILGEGKKQLNALVAFVIGLIFVAAVYPKLVVGNLILFLTVALIVVFVILLLWGFVFAGDKGFEPKSWMLWFLAIVILIAVIIAVLWATGIQWGVFDFLFRQNWSEALWINVIFIVVIAAAVAIAFKGK